MVKLDNTALARPHTGLREADLVYVEEVEWGLTRLAALYNSSFPKVVGPVRSARISDLEILEQFDSPGLVFSGANKTLLNAVAKSNAVSLSPNEMSNYYFRNINSGELNAITQFKNPYEGLKDVSKEVIKYQRNDGVELSGTLYLPAGYDKSKKEIGRAHV